MSNYNELMDITRARVFLRNYVYEDTISILKDHVRSLMVGTDIDYLPEHNMFQIKILNTIDTINKIEQYHEQFKTIFMSYLSDINVQSMINANAFREEDKDIYKMILNLMHNNQITTLYGIEMFVSEDKGTTIILITL